MCADLLQNCCNIAAAYTDMICKTYMLLNEKYILSDCIRLNTKNNYGCRKGQCEHRVSNCKHEYTITVKNDSMSVCMTCVNFIYQGFVQIIAVTISLTHSHTRMSMIDVNANMCFFVFFFINCES